MRPLRRGWDARVVSRFDEALYLQFGGASGTLAALGDRGMSVGEALASELALRVPGRAVARISRPAGRIDGRSHHLYGSLGKMALDVALLMQFEVGEASEPGGEGRGGSSTMPHKRNPTACMLALAAAKRVPGLLADFVAGMVQEHERALGGWQAEWPLVYGIVQSAAVALESHGGGVPKA